MVEITLRSKGNNSNKTYMIKDGIQAYLNNLIHLSKELDSSLLVNKKSRDTWTNNIRWTNLRCLKTRDPIKELIRLLSEK